MNQLKEVDQARALTIEFAAAFAHEQARSQ
jgi:hypothetical protein